MNYDTLVIFTTLESSIGAENTMFNDISSSLILGFLISAPITCPQGLGTHVCTTSTLSIVEPLVFWTIGVSFKCSCIRGCCRNFSLGLRIKVKACKVVGQEGSKSHISSSQECKRVWGSEASHSQVNSHCGSWNPKWTHKFSKCDYRGQNQSFWRVLYIIGKLLKFRYLKWAHITHLGI